MHRREISFVVWNVQVRVFIRCQNLLLVLLILSWYSVNSTDIRDSASNQTSLSFQVSDWVITSTLTSVFFQIHGAELKKYYNSSYVPNRLIMPCLTLILGELLFFILLLFLFMHHFTRYSVIFLHPSKQYTFKMVYRIACYFIVCWKQKR